MIRRAVIRALRYPTARACFVYGTKALSVATKVPLPGVDMAESFVSDGFLPPSVDVTQSNREARALWEESEKAPVMPVGTQELFDSASSET